MLQIPMYISLLFIITTIAAILLFYKATQHNKKILLLISGWVLLQTLISLTGFYRDTSGFPPRFILLAAPPFFIIIGLSTTVPGRKWLKILSLKWLTLLHVIRIPVEIVLLLLYFHHCIPRLMTFEGSNPDILSGITAPLICMLAFRRNKLRSALLLVWNIVCLLLLINIVAHAILSAPTSFQKLAFDQPNIAILYFPYILLPAVVVPLVFVSHIAALLKLAARKTDYK